MTTMQKYILSVAFIVGLGGLYFVIPVQAQALNCDDVRLDETGNEIQATICTPQPRIQFPGLSFTGTEDVSQLLYRGTDGNIYMSAPFLAELIAAMYRWSVAVIAILATIMIIVAGVQWLSSAGNPDTITRAKKRIVNAVIGIILAVGSYTLLSILNPDLINFNALELRYVQGINYLELTDEMVSYDPSGEPVFTPISDGTHRSTPGPNEPLSEAQVLEIASRTNINPCLVLATYQTEASSAHAIGHDENVRSCGVRSRRYFLASGQKLSGEQFTPPAGSNPANYSGDDCDARIFNDDEEQLSNPPDYGLDWRFSHGIGLGQYTIKPPYTYGDRYSETNKRIQGPNGPEWARYSDDADRWYTVTDLLNADLAFEASLGVMLSANRRYLQNGNNPIAFRNRYGGGNYPLDPNEWDRENPPEPRFMRYFCTCLDQRGTTLGLTDDPLCIYYE